MPSWHRAHEGLVICEFGLKTHKVRLENAVEHQTADDAHAINPTPCWMSLRSLGTCQTASRYGKFDNSNGNDVMRAGNITMTLHHTNTTTRHDR